MLVIFHASRSLSQYAQFVLVVHHNRERKDFTTKTFVAKKRHHKYSLLTAGVSRLVVESLSQADSVYLSRPRLPQHDIELYSNDIIQ